MDRMTTCIRPTGEVVQIGTSSVFFSPNLVLYVRSKRVLYYTLDIPKFISVGAHDTNEERAIRPFEITSAVYKCAAGWRR